jgi:hypothetical protein
MSDPRFDARRNYEVPPYRQLDQDVGPVGWLPVAIAGVVIAAIIVFAIAVPRDESNSVQANRPAISTDLDTTGQGSSKQTP